MELQLISRIRHLPRIDPSGHASISRRTQASSVSNSKELLQAGPLLIENHQPITGLDPSKVAMRSILLLTMAGYRWWIGIASPCSLADLSRALSSQSPADWKISHALNLRWRTLHRPLRLLQNLRRNTGKKKPHEPPSQEFSSSTIPLTTLRRRDIPVPQFLNSKHQRLPFRFPIQFLASQLAQLHHDGLTDRIHHAGAGFLTR